MGGGGGGDYASRRAPRGSAVLGGAEVPRGVPGGVVAAAVVVVPRGLLAQRGAARRGWGWRARGGGEVAQGPVGSGRRGG